MSSLARERCLQHPDREAAYRCPLCRRHYCRECGVEHDGRILCVSCLKKLALNVPKASARWSGLIGLTAPLLGLLLAWLFFFGLGQLLLNL